MTHRSFAPPLRLCALVVVAVHCLFAGRAWSATTGEPTTSREARDEAVRAIPFDRLTDDMQQRLEDVVSKPSIYRRLPPQAIDCDPDMYVFLIRHPEIIVDTWKMMGITKLTVKRTGRFTANATDGVGTVSDIELVYGTPEIHVLYADGEYDGPLFRRKVNGRCVVILRTAYARGADNRTRVSSELDVFLKLDNVGAEIMAKTLHPVIGKSVDHNLTQTMEFIERISEAAESNGPGLQRLADQLPNTSPEVRRQFSELTAIVSHRAALRDMPVDDPPATGIRRISTTPGD